MFRQHIARYHFALQYTQQKQVLDLGCGEGYGSELLKPHVASLTSLDVSREAVTITKQRVGAVIVQADGRVIPLKSNSFDVVVSFEVFEHITQVELYLQEIYRILKPGGKYIFSTPNVEYYPLAGLNPWHVKEYTVAEVTELLTNAQLTIDQIFAQVPVNKEIKRLEKSKLLTYIMKIKRKVGIHGDLLPSPLQRKFQQSIAGGKLSDFSTDDYSYLEHKLDEPELIYMAAKK